MWIGIVSLFPEMFAAVTEYGIPGRAVKDGRLSVELVNPRDFTTDRHQTVDDKPYGGGPGMLMKVEPLAAAIEAAQLRAAGDCKVIYLSPQGRRLSQSALAELAAASHLILVAGRYEGIDERVVETMIDAEYSIGDYVLSGGEVPAMVLIDGIARLLPGAVGDPDSVENDSFSDGLLDFPQYTRPEKIGENEVPAVLLSGNHAEISRWRLKQALGRTLERRPDLLAGRELSELEQLLLEEYRRESGAFESDEDGKHEQDH